MSETLEELKAIVDNAPDGATHVNYAYYFKKQYDIDWMYCEKSKSHWKFDDDNAESDIRSLSDIKLIIDLIEASSDTRERYIRNIERQRRHIDP